jgi:hypothetical protein
MGMPYTHPRMQREQKTIKFMIELYCRDHHNSDLVLCSSCQELLNYAQLRLKKCPFQENKTTCGNCPIHCYKPNLREMVREIMRYSGPRLIYKQPIMAICHFIDSFRPKPLG